VRWAQYAADMGHKTCTWDSDGNPEGGNLLDDVGVHGRYISKDPQETGKGSD